MPSTNFRFSNLPQQTALRNSSEIRSKSSKTLKVLGDRRKMLRAIGKQDVTPVQSPPCRSRWQRRQVAALFSDLVSSTVVYLREYFGLSALRVGLWPNTWTTSISKKGIF